MRGGRARRRRSGRTSCAAALAAVLAAVAPAVASPLADAVTLCAAADRAPLAEKRALLERGLDAAERAVAADDGDARAHFAIVCNLGKRMRIDGMSVASLRSLGRLRREIDRTLALDPNHADALVAKAALLYYTPRLFGGDPVEGERLLRTALVVAPRYCDARLELGRVLEARGERDGARAALRRALVDAERAANADVAAEARRLLTRLGG